MLELLLYVGERDSYMHPVIQALLFFYGASFLINMICLRWIKNFVRKIKTTTGEYIPPRGRSAYDREEFPFAYELFASVLVPFYSLFFCVRYTKTLQKIYNVGNRKLIFYLAVVAPLASFALSSIIEIPALVLLGNVAIIVSFCLMHRWLTSKYVEPHYNPYDE